MGEGGEGSGMRNESQSQLLSPPQHCASVAGERHPYPKLYLEI